MTTDINLRISGEIQALRLQHGDIVVVKVPEHITNENAEWIRSFMKERVPMHDVIVLGGGIDMRIVTQEEASKLTEKLRNYIPVPGKIEIIEQPLMGKLDEVIELIRQTNEAIQRLRG